MVIKVKRSSSTPRSGDENDYDDVPRPKFSRKSLESLQDSGDAPQSAPCFQLVDPACEISTTLVSKVASALEKLLNSLESMAENVSQVHASPFHGQQAPPISLEDYLHRIAQYTKCSPACFVAAIVYMDWLYQKDPSMAPCSLSIHRLMLVGSLLATKLLDDKRHSNHFWARVGGISLAEINSLELHMMWMLEYRLLVTPEVMRRYIRQLQAGTLVLGCDHAGEAVGRKRRSTGDFSSGALSGGSDGRKSCRRDSGTAGLSGQECSMGSVGWASSGQTGRGSSGPSYQGSHGSVGLMRQGSLGPDMSLGSVGICGGEGEEDEDEDMCTVSKGPGSEAELKEEGAQRRGSKTREEEDVHEGPAGESKGRGSGGRKGWRYRQGTGSTSGTEAEEVGVSRGRRRRGAVSVSGPEADLVAEKGRQIALESVDAVAGLRAASTSGMRARGTMSLRRVSWADAKRHANDMEQ